MVAAEAGEDYVVRCSACDYEGSREKAAGPPSAPLAADPEGDHSPEPFHTPGQKTIEDLSQFTGLPATSQIKSLVLMADGKAVLALVRGDHSLSETKFSSAVKAIEFRPATPQEILKLFGGEAGSVGPVGVKNMRGVADEALPGRRNMS